MLNFKPNSLSWIELVINKLNRNKVLNLTNISTVLFGSIILIISAKIKVDLYPVPMTLQPLAVLMIGMLYGRNLATATIGLYILQGIAGFPVFAYGGGLLYLFGPTGGFIIGFFIAAQIIGNMSQKPTLGIATGTLAIYICGVLGLMITLNISIVEAIGIGVVPFIIGDLIKASLAIGIAQKLK